MYMKQMNSLSYEEDFIMLILTSQVHLFDIQYLILKPNATMFGLG